MPISSSITEDFPADIDLLAAWRMGDMRAARTLYKRHFDAICRFFRNKLSNLEEVADLVGDTFLELLKTRARESWSDARVSCLRYYLLGIARNVLYGHFRRRSGIKRLHMTSEELEQCTLEELAPRTMSSIVGGRRELDVLIKALRRLPLRDQILLEAKYFEYLPDSDLARLVEIPASTLPGRLRSARNRLLAEVDRLTSIRSIDRDADPGAAMDRWISELRAQIVRTNPSTHDDDDETSSLPVGRDADASWIDHQVATRLFGAMPRSIGPYTVLENLGCGGMGLVYRARDHKLDRTIAVKLLNADCSTPEGARRMHTEAQAMARLSHPNVVQVYEVGQHRERVFLAMEYVEGQNLEVWLRHEHPRAAIHAIFLAVGEGVAAAHSVGIVHRDLKPANILVDAAGRPKVADFGLARTDLAHELERQPTLPDGHRGHSRLTDPGQLLGTPRYMAPEQHDGRSATAASDQFSFCTMLWEALCGQLPYPDTSESPGTRQWLLRPPPRAARLSTRLRRALTRGLAVDPRDRWPSMPTLLAELARPSWLRRHPLIVPLTAILVGVCASLPFAVLLQTPDKDNPCDPKVDILRAHELTQMQAWRTRLARRNDPPEIRRYLEAMLGDWSAEIQGLCHDPSQVPPAEHNRNLLRRGACLAQNAKLLELWFSPDNSQGEVPEYAVVKLENVSMAAPPPQYAEGLGRSCLLSDTEAYDLLRGAASSQGVRAAQEMMRVRLLLHLGRPEEALRRLDALAPHLAPEPPASYHLLRARTLRAADEADHRVMRSLRAAENAAELARDDLTLFDARLEQITAAVDAHIHGQQYNQVTPLPALDDVWEHKLDTAGTILRRNGRDDGDDAVRLLMARIALTRSRNGDPAALLAPLLAAAEQTVDARLRTEIFARYADLVAPEARAQYYEKAIAAAPDDDALRAYLNYVAGLHAFDIDELSRALGYMDAAETHYRRAHGADAPQLVGVAYLAGQALYMRGESAVALAYAEAAVHGCSSRVEPLQRAIALYLRSAIHIRLGAPVQARDDAYAALTQVPADGPDAAMWRTILQTAVVESLVASGAHEPALALARTIMQELDARPELDLGGQRDELELATATAWVHLGKPQRAARALTRASSVDFLSGDDLKRADALALRAGLPGASAATAAALTREALSLYHQLGSDGAARASALNRAPPPGKQ